MKNKLIVIMILLSPLRFFGQPWHSIEYLSDGKIIKLVDSKKYVSAIPIEDKELIIFSAFFGDNKVVVITTNFGCDQRIKMYDKTNKTLREIGPCVLDWGAITIADDYVIGLNRTESTYKLTGYNLSDSSMVVIGELPVSFFSQGKNCAIEDFRINISKKLAYIKLVDKSDWRETKPVSCVVYDFGYGKVILDEPGKPLFEHTNDGDSLFLLREQKLYLLNLHDFSVKPIDLKNIRIEASQSITLMKRHGNAVVLCVTSKKPSILSKFFFGFDFIWLNEYFMGTFENDSIMVNARIKELSNEGLGQIVFD
ncbi:MAG: hypothetical protein HDR38_04330 [Treponema sp.]|nr:hypothetical protein [Treponema sp.]